jgi:hypothetical protein
MKTVEVKKVYYNIVSLYKKANTKSQRALLGYIVKAGHANNPVYGGAFNLVRDIESVAGIYALHSNEPNDTVTEIVHIAESAMLGMWDDFAFSEREISTILMQLGNLKGKGGK